MEYQENMHTHFILNTILVSITTGLGYISVNFADHLRSIDLLLAPIVKMCSILSFIIFLILNYQNIKSKIKKHLQ